MNSNQSVDNCKFPVRVGNCAVALKAKKYLEIRFRVEGKQKTIGQGKFTNENLQTAIALASEINKDFAFRCVDATLEKYKNKVAKSEKKEILLNAAIEKKVNLAEVWEYYKAVKDYSTPRSTQINSWSIVDRLIKENKKYLNFEDIYEFVSNCKSKYSNSTIKRALETLRSAINLAIEAGKCDKNPITKGVFKLVKVVNKDSQRTRQAFSREEVKTIIEAFKKNLYLPRRSAWLHSHYASFVEFVSLTGCRLEEAIALDWDDWKNQNEGSYIFFTKAWSHNEMLPPKNGKTREFLCNEQLQDCLKSVNKIHDKILFPSPKGNRISTGDFTRRHWKPIVQGLVADGELREYLPAYNLRHSFISAMAEGGVGLATVAEWCGNTEETILKHYIAATQKLIPPSL